MSRKRFPIRTSQTTKLFARDNLKRRFTCERRLDGQLEKIARVQQRDVELGAVAAARQLGRAKAAQMVGDELGVEQHEAAGDQPRHEVYQRDFRGAALTAKHALAEKRTPN